MMGDHTLRLRQERRDYSIYILYLHIKAPMHSEVCHIYTIEEKQREREQVKVDNTDII